MHGLARRELYRLLIRAGEESRKRMLETGYNNDYEATAAILFFPPSARAIPRVWLTRRYEA